MVADPGVLGSTDTTTTRRDMGTIALPIAMVDFHRAGHPPAFAYGQPEICFCGRQRDDDASDRRSAFVPLSGRKGFRRAP